MIEREPPAGDDNARRVALLAELSRLGERACASCGRRLGGHDYVASVLLGYKGTPQCLACLAAASGRERYEFLEQIYDYAMQIGCFRAGWEWSNATLGFARGAEPREAFAAWFHEAFESPAGDSARGGESSAAKSVHDGNNAVWDAGDMSCGDLVLELRMRMRALAPGAVLAVTATDPGAVADLPAWCGLTGHTLIEARHPWYRIRRKAE